MTLSKKMWLLLLLFSCVLLGVGLFAMKAFKESIIEARKSEIQSILSFAIKQANYYVELEQSNKMPREEAEANVVRLLSQVRDDNNNFLWANDNHAIARVHVKDKVRGVFQTSYAKYVDTLKQQDFMFVVGESEKVGSSALFVKVNGMTLLPKWNWMMGMGVYIDELNGKMERFIRFIVGISIVVFLVMCTGLYGLYRSIINDLGTEPNVIKAWVSHFMSNDFRPSSNSIYPKNSLMYLICQLNQSLFGFVESLRQQVKAVSAKNDDLSMETSRLEKSISNWSQEKERNHNVLSKHQQYIDQVYGELILGGQTLQAAVHNAAQTVQDERILKKIEMDLIANLAIVAHVSSEVSQAEALLSRIRGAQDLGLGSLNAQLMELGLHVNEIRGSLENTTSELTSVVSSSHSQSISLKSFGDEVNVVQNKIAETSKAIKALMSDLMVSSGVDCQELVSLLSLINHHLVSLKAHSDKMNHELSCLNF